MEYQLGGCQPIVNGVYKVVQRLNGCFSVRSHGAIPVSYVTKGQVSEMKNMDYYGGVS